MTSLTTFRLASPLDLNPLWLNRFRYGHHDGVVDDAGAVALGGLSLDFQNQSDALPSGTRVKVWLTNHFVCADVREIERAEQTRKEKLAQAAAEAGVAQAHRLAEDLNFNNSLALPVKWQSGIKDVLSGLSEKSMGDGRNRATVNHILLLEDLHVGRLHRVAGDFLCTSNAQSNGKNWSGQPGEPSGRITCARCLELAKKWRDGRGPA